ncbi:alpha-1,3-mannosyl-glycoprotein 2-beta-N-acetylglucosaminyltransferase-like isoform X1 [Saccostrea echinata]|uniref:alpha-1,3-mannosyl-glycoprotein 2-beta-N-acetylglucosaminyltransferase-like isoform X1 n=1 Tax=Saccostrea echinata TaxID=191078 RepID=UPI002A808278|nr:alpha-1,3-mannosyl-glycoprotein 2-beta-N-acetylglucosaminyltransferase-like isoform X1 [Saccostrea echinata]XP_061195003.1 alpha-1,3-mannosyl-glycoprotein 2-beta-N-acetylglucosaminyltransferase-like isoform X1 [Saccostrea echinata]
MRRKHLVAIVVVIFLTWNLLMYYMLVSKNPGKTGSGSVEDQLRGLQGDIHRQLSQNSELLQQLRKFREQKLAEKLDREIHKTTTPVPFNIDKIILPILLIACDRTTVSRSLDLLLKYRPNKDKFPIIVSQDCGHKPTADVIQRYVVDHGIQHIKHPNLSDIHLPWPQKKFQGYYKLSRHYKWALNQVFHTYNHSAVIIVEDDLDVSPDFYEYFSATFPILHQDPSLWCVSAWNDNGKVEMVSDDAELLYRTDFFPGLGWMMEKSTWLELGPKWPNAFWDDWMRHPDQRKGRACIRPEICRTSTFGKKGVSKGLFYEKHLKFIKLNNKFVPFTKKDLTYLMKDKYDAYFTKLVKETPEVTVAEAMSGHRSNLKALKILYSTKEEFKSTAKKLGIMDDFKAGVPRVAYNGVVSFIYRGQRIYLSPPPNWKGYDLKWS